MNLRISAPAVVVAFCLVAPAASVAKAPKCTIKGSNKSEVLKGTSKKDVICAMGGNDKVYARGGDDIVLGGGGNDLIDGGSGNDRLSGDSGADKLSGTKGADSIDGGSGDDLLVGGSENDRLLGSTGKDTIDGLDGRDVIVGGSGDDHLRGGNGDDQLAANEGEDELVGGPGNDRLDGGAGRDDADYSTSRQPVTVDLGSDTSNGDGKDALPGIEDVRGTPFGDEIAGDSARNSIDAGGGDDALRGGSGDDNLLGGPGADKLYGEPNDDALDGGPGSDYMDGGSGRNSCRFDPEDQVEPNCDSTAPAITSVRAPAQVDTSASSRTVEIDLDVTDDLAGVQCVFVTLQGPGSQLVQNGCASRIAGDEMSGTYRMQLTLPRYSQQGNWRVAVETGDRAENRGTTSSAAVVEQVGVGDNTAPQLAAIRAPAQVDTSASSRTVEIDLDVTDDLAGVQCVFVTLQGPGNQLVQNGCATRIAGNELSGTYRMQLTLPRYSQQGNWRVAVELGDTAENRRSSSSAAVVAQVGVGDQTAPTLQSIVASPASVDASGSSQDVQVDLGVTDDLSGVQCVFVTLQGPGNQLIQNGCATRISGNELSGTYRMQLTLPRYSQSGTWRVAVELGDQTENRRSLSSAASVTVR